MKCCNYKDGKHHGNTLLDILCTICDEKIKICFSCKWYEKNIICNSCMRNKKISKILNEV